MTGGPLKRAPNIVLQIAGRGRELEWPAAPLRMPPQGVGLIQGGEQQGADRLAGIQLFQFVEHRDDGINRTARIHGKRFLRLLPFGIPSGRQLLERHGMMEAAPFVLVCAPQIFLIGWLFDRVAAVRARIELENRLAIFSIPDEIVR